MNTSRPSRRLSTYSSPVIGRAAGMAVAGLPCCCVVMLHSLRLALRVSQARNGPVYRDYRGRWRRRLAQQQLDSCFPTAASTGRNANVSNAGRLCAVLLGMAILLHGGRVRLLAAALAVLTVVAALLAAVAPFQAAKASGPESEFAISISGTDGAAYFLPGHAQVNVTQTWNASSPGNYEAIQVYVSAGSTIYNFDFATGYGGGKRFAVGYYPWAQQYPGIRGQFRPGISVTGGSNPCGSSSGSFEVRDIGRVGLQITRLSIVFTRWCEDGGVDIGQVQFGYPATTYNVSPKVVDWPWSTVYPGNAAPENHPVNVRLTSAKTVTVSQPKVTGPDAADFPIRKQNCTGKLTTTGCAVWVGFTPKKPGPRHATLIVPTSAGSTSVSLDGLGGVGTSTWNVSTNWPGTPANFSMPSVSAGDPYSII